MLLASALVLGFLHGLGADHLMAIAALSVGGAAETAAVQRSRAIGVAVRFALGHSLLLALGAGALLALGWSLPVMFERAGEVLGGVLLIGLGGIGLWGVRAGRVYGHSHPHRGEPAPHWHLHIGRADRHPLDAAHSHLPTILGAAFALSSLRALTMLTPAGDRVVEATAAGAATAAPLGTLLALVAVFGVGILLSMSLFGVAFARLLSAAAAARLGRAAAAVMALASIALGLFWVARA